jgi:hypothetical protein
MAPWSMLGANVDILMYQMMSPQLRDAVSLSSWTADVNVSIFRETIAKSILREDPQFNPGISFLRKQQHAAILENSARAIEVLRRKGLEGPGRFSYANEPERLVTRALSEEGKLQNIVKEEKNDAVRQINDKEARYHSERREFWLLFPYGENNALRLTLALRGVRGYTFTTEKDYYPWTNKMGKVLVHVMHDIKDVLAHTYATIGWSEEDEALEQVPKWTMAKDALVSRGLFGGDMTDLVSVVVPKPADRTLPDVMSNKYSWQNGFYFKYGDIVERKYQRAPIAGARGWVDTLLSTVGMSSDGDDLVLKMNKVARALGKDKTMPRDITLDMLYRLTMHPSVRHDAGAVQAMLEAVGASPDNAARFAISLFNEAADFMFYDKTQSFSTRDMIIGNMDQTRNNYERFVVMISMGDRRVDDFIKAIAFLHTMINPAEEVRKTEVMFAGNETWKMQKELLGELFVNDLEYFRVYPSRDI